jgi:hypothetical protein
MFNDTKIQTVVWQTVEERVAQIATERSWIEVYYHVENNYPGWTKEQVTDFRVNYIPDWVQRRLDVILKYNLPVREVFLMHEPEPTTITRVEKALGADHLQDWEKAVMYVGLAALAVLGIGLILGVVLLVGLASACASGDPACVIVIDDGTPQGTWIEVGRWV